MATKFKGKVIDRNGEILGTIDHPVRDDWGKYDSFASRSVEL